MAVKLAVARRGLRGLLLPFLSSLPLPPPLSVSAASPIHHPLYTPSRTAHWGHTHTHTHTHRHSSSFPLHAPSNQLDNGIGDAVMTLSSSPFHLSAVTPNAPPSSPQLALASHVSYHVTSTSQ
ncbi:hypothetical protein E2C01_004439 [Portunus trituberculatus]|uniref:Uncharacterized protein n=1 Tax=Portunus trituberculatus TaxID=210409 RepID=A0A5B7CT00_PORTR|nr:hypothetical protein [Portunus trituberculatus]